MAESIKDVASEKDLERLEKALDFSNTMKTFNLNKNNLKVKTQNLLSYSTAGGSFTVDQSLISFMNFVVSSGKTEITLLDKKLLLFLLDLCLFLYHNLQFFQVQKVLQQHFLYHYFCYLFPGTLFYLKDISIFNQIYLKSF